MWYIKKCNIKWSLKKKKLNQKGAATKSISILAGGRETLEWNWGMEFKTLQVFRNSVKVLTLVIGKLSMHFIISKVITQITETVSFPKNMSEKYLINPKRGKIEEKDGTSKHTHKKMAGNTAQIYQ